LIGTGQLPFEILDGFQLPGNRAGGGAVAVDLAFREPAARNLVGQYKFAILFQSATPPFDAQAFVRQDCPTLNRLRADGTPREPFQFALWNHHLASLCSRHLDFACLNARHQAELVQAEDRRALVDRERALARRLLHHLHNYFPFFLPELRYARGPASEWNEIVIISIRVAAGVTPAFCESVSVLNYGSKPDQSRTATGTICDCFDHSLSRNLD